MDEPFEAMDAPMRLLKPDKARSTLVPCHDALEFLKSIRSHVAVISVVGGPRQGKSSLLNLMFHRSMDGFAIERPAGKERATEGVWMWLKRHPRNEDIVVMFLDTESMRAERDDWYTWTVCTLSLLLSTVFMYQTKGDIHDEHKAKLDMLLQLSEQVRGGTDEGGAEERSTFVWLIRDNVLDTRKMPRDEMMELLQTGQKASLERCFKDADCVPLPAPVDDEAVYDAWGGVKFSALRESFREDFVVLVRKLYEIALRPRNVNGRPLTGKAMAEMMYKYLEFIGSVDAKSRAIEALPTRQRMTVKIAGDRAVESAVKCYTELMRDTVKLLPIDEDTLGSRHEAALAEARTQFHAQAVPETVESDVFVRRFEDAIAKWKPVVEVYKGESVRMHKPAGGLYESILRENNSKSREHCSGVITALYAPIRAKLGDNAYHSVEEYVSDVAALKQSYNESKEACGPQKSVVMEEFMHAKQIEQEVMVASLTEKRVNARMEERMRWLQDKFDAQMSVFKDEVRTQLATVEEETTRLRSTVVPALESSLQSECAALRDAIDKLRSDVETVHVPALQDAQQRSHDTTYARIQDMDGRLTVLGNEVRGNERDTKNSIERMRADNEQALADATTRLAAAEGKLSDDLPALHTRIKDAAAALDAKCADVAEQGAQGVAALREEMERVSGRVDSLHTELGDTVTALHDEVNGHVDARHATMQETMKAQAEDVAAQATALTARCDELQSAMDTQHEHMRKLHDEGTAALDAQIGDVAARVGDVEKKALPAMRKRLGAAEDKWEGLIRESIGHYETRMNGFSLRMEALDEALRKQAPEMEVLRDHFQRKLMATSEDLHKQLSTLSESQHTMGTELANTNRMQRELHEQVERRLNVLAKLHKEHTTALREGIERVSGDLNTRVPQLAEDVEALRAHHDAAMADAASTLESQLADVNESLSVLREEVGKEVQNNLVESMENAKTLVENRIGETLKAQVKQEMKLNSLTAELKQRLPELVKSLETSNEQLLTQLGEVRMALTSRVDELDGKLNQQLPDLESFVNNVKVGLQRQMSASEEKQASILASMQERVDSLNTVLTHQLPELRKALDMVQDKTEREFRQAEENQQEQLQGFEERLDQISHLLGSQIPDLRKKMVAIQDDLRQSAEVTQSETGKLDERIVAIAAQLQKQFPEVTEELERAREQWREQLAGVEERTRGEVAAQQGQLEQIGAQLASELPTLRDEVEAVRRELGDEIARGISTATMGNEDLVARLNTLTEELHTQVPELSDAIDAVQAAFEESVSAVRELATGNEAQLSEHVRDIQAQLKRDVPELRTALRAITERVDTQVKLSVAENQKQILSLASRMESLSAQTRAQMPELKRLLGSMSGQFMTKLQHEVDGNHDKIVDLHSRLDRVREDFKKELASVRDSNSAIWQSIDMVSGGMSNLLYHIQANGTAAESSPTPMT